MTHSHEFLKSLCRLSRPNCGRKSAETFDTDPRPCRKHSNTVGIWDFLNRYYGSEAQKCKTPPRGGSQRTQHTSPVWFHFFRAIWQLFVCESRRFSWSIWPTTQSIFATTSLATPTQKNIFFRLEARETQAAYANNKNFIGCDICS